MVDKEDSYVDVSTLLVPVREEDVVIDGKRFRIRSLDRGHLSSIRRDCKKMTGDPNEPVMFSNLIVVNGVVKPQLKLEHVVRMGDLVDKLTREILRLSGWLEEQEENLENLSTIQ